MRGVLEEFNKFIDQGNVLDLAIGVVIGGVCGFAHRDSGYPQSRIPIKAITIRDPMAQNPKPS